MKITETLNNTLNYSKDQEGDKHHKAEFYLKDSNITVKVHLMHTRTDFVDVKFGAIGEDVEIPENVGESFMIFATISQILTDHVEKHDIRLLGMTPSTRKRGDIFEKILERTFKDWNVERDASFVLAYKK